MTWDVEKIDTWEFVLQVKTAQVHQKQSIGKTWLQNLDKPSYNGIGSNPSSWRAQRILPNIHCARYKRATKFVFSMKI